MTGERKPVAFGDMRGWISALRAEGELKEINALVDWNVELGTIVRVAQGAGTGPALLFNNIKDYNGPKARGRRVRPPKTSPVRGGGRCGASFHPDGCSPQQSRPPDARACATRCLNYSARCILPTLHGSGVVGWR